MISFWKTLNNAMICSSVYDLRYGDTLKEQLASYRSNPNSTESKRWDVLRWNFLRPLATKHLLFLFSYLTYYLEVSHLTIPTSQTDETNPVSQLPVELELMLVQTFNKCTFSEV